MEEKAAAFADAGFKVWMTDANNLDLAFRHGMFMMARAVERLPRLAAGQDPRRLEQWKQLYTEEMKKKAAHPALLGYFISDEPAWRGIPPEPLLESYQFIRSIDPYKPVMLNEAPRGRIADLRAYVNAFDIYGVDIYPVPAPGNHSALSDKMMTDVGKYTDICREVVEERKPVWMTLQGFSWEVITGKSDTVFPSHKENRFMAYNALLHGATGLFCWGFCRRIMISGWNEFFCRC